MVRATAQDPTLTSNHEVAVRYTTVAERELPEVAMRIGTALLIAWLVIGAIAAGQRHYYSGNTASCVNFRLTDVAQAAWQA